MFNQPLPVVRGGYCIRLYDTFLVYGPTGQLAFAALPQLHGAYTVYIHDVAVDPDGWFVVAAGNHPDQQGLAVFDQYGNQKAFIPTGDFYPSNVGRSPAAGLLPGAELYASLGRPAT